MDTNTYVGKIKRTRKRWRKYSRQLRKAGLNPEFYVADYRIKYLPMYEVDRIIEMMAENGICYKL